ncbi:hypothetical protein [Muriicola jejuensis]|uniref:Uncharacterized protein n=1 Tax=Muriicola jejuensis TaxID=504488 RepID=A0A6P0U8S1_9FLAO|nr:hypothetical protein [Muriicola jejuensis]NER09565.1 hypothetical protein [Muriicola jejuensis]
MAGKILEERRITYLSLDWLVMGFTNGMPEVGIRDTLFPDEIAERSWPFLQAMLESMIYVETDCVIEGEALLPGYMAELIKKHPDNIRICFLGYTDVSIWKKIEQIKKFSTGTNDWLTDKSDDYIADHINNMIAHSKNIKQACEENHIAYFDTSDHFDKAIEDAVDHLLG